jgi:non-ribosomal peptide synthetase component F
MTLLAAWQTLLHCYTGQEQVLVGTPIANRNRAETEGLLGFFVNTLVMRGDMSGNPGFVELLRRVREVCLGAYAHQDLPFEKLVEDLRPERSLSHSPLFQVWFALHNANVSITPRLGELKFQEFNVDRMTSKMDLILTVRDEGPNFKVFMEYNSDLFNAETVCWMLQRLRSLLLGVVAQPEIQLQALKEIFLQEQKKQESAKENELEVLDRQILKSIKRKPISVPSVR